MQRSQDASWRSRRNNAALALRCAGAGRLSDAFLIPCPKDPAWRGAYYAKQMPARWRSHESPHYIRIADVPFDLLPLRPHATERAGAFFSIGPGLTLEGEPHPGVLLAQIEGPAALFEQLRGRVEGVFESLTTAHRKACDSAATVIDGEAGGAGQDWCSLFLAGLLI